MIAMVRGSRKKCVPLHAGGPGDRSPVTRGRLEALSDGVFAIAAILLVLNRPTPETRSGLASALLQDWPFFATYAVSFVTVGIIWINHTNLFGHLASLDRPLVYLNLLLVLIVAFTPYRTAVFANHLRSGGDGARVAAATYGVTMTLMGSVSLVSAPAALVGYFVLPGRALVSGTAGPGSDPAGEAPGAAAASTRD